MAFHHIPMVGTIRPAAAAAAAVKREIPFAPHLFSPLVIHLDSAENNAPSFSPYSLSAIASWSPSLPPISGMGSERAPEQRGIGRKTA